MGEENKAQENASSGDCHTWMITLLFFVPDFPFFSGRIIITLFQ